MSASLPLLCPRPARAETHIQEIVSPGGITAWLVEDHTLPLIAVNFAFDKGSATEPEGKEGVTQLLTYMLDEGAGDLDSFAFQSEIQARSIRLSFDATRDAFYGDLAVLSTEKDRAFALLALALSRPRFDAEPLERMRQAALSNIDASANDPDSIANDALMQAIFADTPYARPSDGTSETVSALSAADLEAARARLFTRNGLKVGIVGAISAEEAGAMLDQVFGGLEEGSEAPATPLLHPAGGETISVERDIAQTVIRIAFDGPLRSDDDFLPLYVANHILGGGSFSSRLFRAVREERGLAYGVYTYLAPLDHAGFIGGGAATRPDRSAETIEVMRAEIARFAREGVTEEELRDAKDYLIGSYALRFDTSQKIARQILGLQMESLGIDYPERRAALIEALSVDDINRVARHYFTPEPTIVTVGHGGNG